MQASTLRRLGAWYIDLALLTTVYGFGASVLGLLPAAHLATMLPAAAAVRLATSRLAGRTPGSAILAIGKDGSVDSAVAAESCATMTVAFVFFVGGLNQAVRWSSLPFPLPLFGWWPSPGVSVAIDLLLGSALVVTAIMLFRLRPIGWYAAVCLVAGILLSTIVDWSHWQALVPQIVLSHRSASGAPLREGELEAMQAILPAALVLGCLVLLTALFGLQGRLRTAARLR